jgi:hypothetical protein
MSKNSKKYLILFLEVIFSMKDGQGLKDPCIHMVGEGDSTRFTRA